MGNDDRDTLPDQLALGIPSERDRYLLKRNIVLKKVNTRLLPLMRAHEVDMWVIVDREGHPDPMSLELGGSDSLRNAHIFYDDGQRLEKIFVFSHRGREDLAGALYDQMIHYGYRPGGLGVHLSDLIRARNPRRIAVNVAPTLGAADGLTVEMKRYLDEALGPELAGREVSAELLVRDFRTTRLPEETEVYRRLVEWTVVWGNEALSRLAVEPGVTTSDDLQWWMRNRARDLGLDAGTCSAGARIIREGRNLPANDAVQPILPGDVISLDFGLSFIGYRTDLKRTAYVLRPGETALPESFQRAFAAALEAAAALAGLVRPGLLGHQAWEMAMEWATAHGYAVGYPVAGGTAADTGLPEMGVYCHSTGTTSHDIGARIAETGPRDFSERVRYPLAADNWYALEMHVAVPVLEWGGRLLKIGLEEDVLLTPRGVEYLSTTQREWILIPS